MTVDRRTLLRAAGWATAVGLTGRRGFAATDAELAALVTLLEGTPRERLPRELVGLIRSGLSPEDFSGALAVAAARNVQPFPDVGFKYHAFMVVHATHATAQNLTGQDRWLPKIWAADYFKRTQAEEQRDTGWRLGPSPATLGVSEAVARGALTRALDRFDREAADAAIVDYARLATNEQLFAVLFAYGARDLREIGHKAITVQNVHRLMPLLGPEQAEPLLRSTVAAIVNPGTDDANPADNDFAADRPWRALPALLEAIPAGWRGGRVDANARTELLANLREVSELDAARAVVEMLRAGIAPDTIWQALFAAGTELLMRMPGVVPVHAVTTANALHYAYRHSSDEALQQRLLLQCAAFMPLFRGLVRARATLTIDALEPMPVEGEGAEALDDIFTEIARDRLVAVRKTMSYLAAGGNRAAFIAAARRYLAHNSDQTHDYKFAEAAFDNNEHIAASGWRDLCLAASVIYLTGASARTRNPAVAEAAELLGA